MVVYEEINEIKSFLSEKIIANNTIGFVPTMGALHSGHLRLLEEARKENDILVSSIFVNPTQFNNPEDFDKYPQDVSGDLRLMDKAACDVVFTPSVDEMYPEPVMVQMNFGAFESGLEGTFRPGHFNGVAVVLMKLFHIVNPTRAYFGQKDLQQATIVSHLVKDLYFPTEIRIIPTMREDDGLAASSRNRRLNGDERRLAPRFFEALKHAQKELLAGQPIKLVKSQVEDFINQASNMRLEYFEIIDSGTLQPVETINPADKISLCIAGYVGDIRLLDNIYLK